MIKVAINGFGRIGRHSFKALLKKYENEVEIVAINDLTDPYTLAHLLKYDSLYGKFCGTVEVQGNDLVVNGKKIHIIAERNPEALPWKDLNVDIVIESTGLFTTGEKATMHLKAGAKKVLISAPGKGDQVKTIVMGVNENEYDPKVHNIVSNASCTTNCLAPFAKVLNDDFGIKRGIMTTVHSYTNDQKILDLPHSDLRRARAAAESMIPTTTGAAEAVSKVIPSLKGKFTGMAVRVPTPTVSLVDLTAELEKPATAGDLNKAFKYASENQLKGILGYSDEPLVSIDYRGDERSSIVDGLSTLVIGDNLVKIISWYDNEWGYSNRVADLVDFIAKKGF